MVTYVGDSTERTAAAYVTLVPRARQPESKLWIMFLHLQNLNRLSVQMITSLETVDYCEHINKVFVAQRSQTAQ